MQHLLGDGSDLQQHMQTAASLGAYAQQLRAQQAADGGTVASTADPASAAVTQPNGMAAHGMENGATPHGTVPPLRQHPRGGPSQGLSAADLNISGGGGGGAGGGAGTSSHPAQGVTHPPPPGHHAWRVTADRQFQLGAGGAAGSSLPSALAGSAAANGWQGSPRPARLPAPPAAAATAPRFPINYSPLPQTAAAPAHHVAPRRFFGDHSSSSEIQPADDPPEPSMRFLYPPGPGFGGLSRGTAPQQRGETYAEVRGLANSQIMVFEETMQAGDVGQAVFCDPTRSLRSDCVVRSLTPAWHARRPVQN